MTQKDTLREYLQQHGHGEDGITVGEVSQKLNLPEISVRNVFNKLRLEGKLLRIPGRRNQFAIYLYTGV